MKFLISVFVRTLVPVIIIAGGAYGYLKLSTPPPAEPREMVEKKKLRSQVRTLVSCDFVVTIETNGVVGPHNRVALSSEVTGTILATETAFEVGSFFKAGDLLLAVDDRDYRTALTIAKEQHNLAVATLKLAQSGYERMQALLERKSASDSEVDTMRSALLQAEAQVEITASAIERAQRDLDRTKIKAPFNGRVANKQVGSGQLVSPGSVLGEVFAVDFAEVRLPIASRELKHLDLPEMESDPPVEVELRDAIDPDSEARWQGKIVRTEGSLDTNSLELFAIARIEDPFALQTKRPVLRIGQPVVATIKGNTLRDVVAFPRGAVRRMDQVHLIDGKSHVLRTLTLTPLWSDAQFVVCRKDPVREGELLALSSFTFAPEGTEVEIIPGGDSNKSLVGKPADMEPTP
jgi:membrane fusion protein, multidrug efflux system